MSEVASHVFFYIILLLNSTSLNIHCLAWKYFGSIQLSENYYNYQNLLQWSENYYNLFYFPLNHFFAYDKQMSCTVPSGVQSVNLYLFVNIQVIVLKAVCCCIIKPVIKSAVSSKYGHWPIKFVLLWQAISSFVHWKYGT